MQGEAGSARSWPYFWGRLIYGRLLVGVRTIDFPTRQNISFFDNFLSFSRKTLGKNQKKKFGAAAKFSKKNWREKKKFRRKSKSE